MKQADDGDQGASKGASKGDSKGDSKCDSQSGSHSDSQSYNKAYSVVVPQIAKAFRDFFADREGERGAACDQYCPGIQYAITYQGQVVHSEAFGMRRFNPDLPMDTSSLSRVASISKSFAAAAALKLRDAGALDLDVSISQIVPAMELAEPYRSGTLRELMGMKLDLPKDDSLIDRMVGFSNAEIDPYFARTTLRSGKGDNFCSYSNISYMLLGRIIGEVSGGSALEYISREIIQPLGMSDTVWNPSGAHLERVAHGYRDDCFPAVAELSYTSGGDAAVFVGLWSTVADLAIWLEFLRGESEEAGAARWEAILSSASRQELSRAGCARGQFPFRSRFVQAHCDQAHFNQPHFDPLSFAPGHSGGWGYLSRDVNAPRQLINPVSDYGLGIVRHSWLGETYLSHAGGLPGYGAYMIVNQRTGWGMAALGNGRYCGLGETCLDALQYLVRSQQERSQQEEPSAGSGDEVVRVGTELARYLLSGMGAEADAAAEAAGLFADNFWHDNLKERFKDRIRAALANLGDTPRLANVQPFSGYQGELFLEGAENRLPSDFHRLTLEFHLGPFLPAQVMWVQISQ